MTFDELREYAKQQGYNPEIYGYEYKGSIGVSATADIPGVDPDEDYEITVFWFHPKTKGVTKLNAIPGGSALVFASDITEEEKASILAGDMD
jgi:hypothetical protein